MSTQFDKCFEIVVGIEGVYSKDPTDPGNWTGGKEGSGSLKGTKYGISSKAHPQLDIENLTLDGAKDIYKAQYYDAYNLDRCPWHWALTIFDGEVNQGEVIELAQTAVGVKPDDIIGPITQEALAKFDIHSFQFKSFLALRLLRYTTSSIFNQDGKGWYIRIMTIHEAAILQRPVPLTEGASTGLLIPEEGRPFVPPSYDQ